MAQVSLQEIITKIDKLPELPQVALQLNQLLDDPNVNANRLAEVIRVDPSFTSQVLRLCNSAAYGFNRKISTVKEAVAILGFKVLKSMVYTIIAKITLDKAVPGYSLSKGDLWFNALTCALYAKHIAQKERFHDPELAFTGGLLRDIGKIVLGDYVGANFADIEKHAVEKQIDFREAEQEVIGFSHTIVGARIAEKWNLPSHLVEVIKHHHKPGQLGPMVDANVVKLVNIVHLADAFTMMVGQGMGSDSLMYSLDEAALQKCGIPLNEEKMAQYMGELVDLNPLVQQIASTFNQGAGESP
ncbi:MAG: HDOD domain-containing protein [Candidatus Melainabacteria bacterium]